MPGNYTEEDKIRLKPFLGLRPGVYLCVIYGLVILAALFFLLLFPGISRPGSVVTVKSEPWGAAVRLDGVYQGSAPCEFFVPRGSHSLELVLPGFESRKIEAEIPGRLAFSLFFPRRLSFGEQLSPENAASSGGVLTLTAGAGDYAAWTFAGEPTDAYQIPRSLSEAFYRAGPFLSGDAGKEADETLRAAARFALTRAALRDLIRAKTLADNGGLSPSPLSLLHSAEDALSWLDENAARSEDTAPWLAGLLPANLAGPLRSSPWYAARSGTSPAERPGESGGSFSGGAGRISLGGLSFAEIPGEGLYIGETEVSAASYDAFLEDEPRWRRENREALADQGLVNGDYLDPGPPGAGDSSGSGGVRGVSWHAASAFCAWLKRQLPPDWEGALVRFPTEAEWTAYVRDARFWEWCQDPYAPLAFLSASPAAIERVSSPERVLRGGFRIGSVRQREEETRASLPPEFCSPFVSFRPLIVLPGAAGGR
ncbi:MAG: SUMF1/EgtB/PvdO family nonheme iron enzyme [Treponema sp.]|nr:SUMF1/EgtB/PvdO family nonheme iron enzyme [Treponema sp.]